MYIHSFKSNSQVWLTDDASDDNLKKVISENSGSSTFAVHDVKLKGENYKLAVKTDEIDVTDVDKCIEFARQLTTDIDVIPGPNVTIGYF